MFGKKTLHMAGTQGTNLPGPEHETPSAFPSHCHNQEDPQTQPKAESAPPGNIALEPLVLTAVIRQKTGAGSVQVGELEPNLPRS